MTRGLVLWLLIMALETVHGILRGLFLVPRVGEAMAANIGWAVGTLIVVAASTLLIGRTGLRDRRELLILGAAWAGLTLIFEIGIGVLRGFPAARLWAEVNPLAGGLMLYSLAVMFAAPLVGARIARGKSVDLQRSKGRPR